jgi:hypothetical protein
MKNVTELMMRSEKGTTGLIIKNDNLHAIWAKIFYRVIMIGEVIISEKSQYSNTGLMGNPEDFSFKYEKVTYAEDEKKRLSRKTRRTIKKYRRKDESNKGIMELGGLV